MSQNGKITFLSFKYDFQIGHYTSGEGRNEKICQSLAAVVEGSVAYCTPLSKYCPPPPMSHFQVKFNGQIIDLFFGKNSIGAIILEGTSYKAQLFSYDWDNGSTTGQVCLINLDGPVEWPRLSCLVQQNNQPDQLYYVSGSNKNTGVMSCGASNEFASGSCQIFNSGISLSWVANPSHSSANNHLLAYFSFDGSIHSYPNEGLHLELPVDAHQITKIVNFQDKEGHDHYACLTEGSHLYVDRELIADSCTSFFCADGFFLFTVMTQGMFDMLYIYPIKDLVKAKAAVLIR